MRAAQEWQPLPLSHDCCASLSLPSVGKNIISGRGGMGCDPPPQWQPKQHPDGVSGSEVPQGGFGGTALLPQREIHHQLDVSSWPSSTGLGGSGLLAHPAPYGLDFQRLHSDQPAGLGSRNALWQAADTGGKAAFQQVDVSRAASLPMPSADDCSGGGVGRTTSTMPEDAPSGDGSSPPRPCLGGRPAQPPPSSELAADEGYSTSCADSDGSWKPKRRRSSRSVSRSRSGDFGGNFAAPAAAASGELPPDRPKVQRSQRCWNVPRL